MRDRLPGLSQSLLAVFTLGNVRDHQQHGGNLDTALYLIANPTGSLTALVGTKAAVYLYDVVGKTVALDKLLRTSLLPPKRIVGTLNVLHKILNGVSACCPTVMHPIFPVHVLCEDTALLVSHARHTLSAGTKIKACIIKVGTIAKETIVHETAIQLRISMESKIKSTAYSILPAPTNTAQVAPDASWAGTVWGYASKAVTVSTNLLVEEGTKYACNKSVQFVKDQAENTINDCTARMNDQIDELEHNYLNQVSAVVVDNTAKQALALCFSTGAGYLVSTYVVPNVTKLGLSYVMGDAAAEAVTTTVKVLSVGYTAFGFYSTVAKYGSNRQRNHERYARKIDNIESNVSKALTSTVEAGLARVQGVQGSFTLYGQDKFAERCEVELPQAFNSGCK